MFAVLWWLERAERKECQKSNKELLVQTLDGINRASSSVTTFTAAVGELRNGFTTLTTSLTSLVRSIKRV